jgi:hypothetical protein
MARGIPFTLFVSASPASIAGVLKDSDRVMIADMPSRIYQRIHSGILDVK